MVRIINGEILADDDPRVKTLRQRVGEGSKPDSSTGRNGGGIASIHGAPDSSRDQQRPPAEHRGVLDMLAQMVGVEGRTLRIPEIMGMPEKEVPYIYLILAAVVVLFGGAKALIVIVAGYILTNQEGRRQR